MDMKRCSKCKIKLPSSDFCKDKNKSTGLASACRKCHSKRQREYSQRPEVKIKKREYMRGYDNKHYKETRRDVTLKYKYGENAVEIYNKLFKTQEGCCAICGIHQSELKKKLSVDHSHLTKIIRGLLCPKCNDGLGRFCADSGIELLQRAVEYIKGVSN